MKDNLFLLHQPLPKKICVRVFIFNFTFIVIQTLLQKYKERCRLERTRQESDKSPLALLLVSFGHAAASPLDGHWGWGYQWRCEGGCVWACQCFILSTPIRGRSFRTTDCLSPIPAPQLSLGPEPVSEEARAEEHRQFLQENPPKKRQQSSDSSGPKPKKAKPAPPKLVERRTRAAARMAELGITPLEVYVGYIHTHKHTR